ncbi:MAG: CHAD domain-containing protein [Thiocapsa sp.]|jgi:CHAD domain-containing protein|nr:CHAD domain-containing protein [Thiocapsa sp.]MCG6984095.1 CHAD domain-containing protein [Thiocapsa sp.]
MVVSLTIHADEEGRATRSTDIELLVPFGTRLNHIVDWLSENFRPSLWPSETATRTFYDTFDWAIFCDGGALECRSQRSGRRWVWTALQGDAPQISQAMAGEPGLALDLPNGPVRERICGLCGVRRLLPVAEVESQVTPLRLVNDDAETLLRLELEEPLARDPAGAECRSMQARLRLLPEHHHHGIYRQVSERLVSELGLVPAETPLLSDALASCGRRPSGYSSKLAYRLDPHQRADEATRVILRGLLDTLIANIEGVRENLDTEFLHDLRVATRRTRSALGQIKDVLPQAIVDEYKARFAWLQQATGPTRDLDVYLLDFDRYQQAIPARLQTALESVRAYLRTRQTEEQRRLVGHLDSAEFSHLIEEWRAFLDAPISEHVVPAKGARPIKSVADERIRRMVKRVRREGLAIRPDSPDEELHELRKSCKKLRYLMEFFESLYPKDKIARLIKLLKKLLDHLGLLQDLAVQAGHLHDWAEQMRTEGMADTDTLLAMGALIGQLLERQERARKEFAAVFADYIGDDNQALFRTLFASA